MSMAAAIGCGSIGCVVGAEELSESAGVWVKTRFYREGNFLCATVYSVAAGEPKVVELRVDLRPIARAVMRAHTALHARAADLATVRGQPVVGWSLGKLWKGAKNAAKAIGRSKLVKGVVSVTKTVARGVKAVAKSKAFGAVLSVAAVFPLTAPFAAPALGAYAAANAAIKGVEVGAKVVRTAKSVASTITQGKRLARQVTSTTARANSAVRAVSSVMTPAARAAIATRARAASQIRLSTQGRATVAASLARAPAGAARTAFASSLASRLKTVAQLRSTAVIAKSLPAAAGSAVARASQLQLKAAPIIARAAAVAKKLEDPKVRAQLVAARAQAAKAEAALATVKSAAASGSLDGQKSAAIVNLVARNRARIQAMSQANAGGLPGVLITKQGKLVRGRFRVQAQAGANGTLYQGAGKPRESGAFATVSGRAPRVGQCYDIAGDLPLDGVRMTGKGPNASDLGMYEVEGSLIGCGGNCGCAPCAAAS